MKRIIVVTLLLAVASLTARSITWGDVNQDGAIDISDVNLVINVMLGKSANVNADLYRDGKVDVSDVNMLINLLLGKRPRIEVKPRYMWIDASANFPTFADSKDNIRRDLLRAGKAGITDVVVDVRPTEGDVLFECSVMEPQRR